MVVPGRDEPAVERHDTHTASVWRRPVTTRQARTARTVRRTVAGIATTLTVARVVLWIAKAIATAGTVDTALEILGLHGPVDEFEQAFDAAIAPFVLAARAAWDAYQAARL